MYLRSTKTELEAAGESTEGMADSISKLREELLALTHGKVDIQLDEDSYKSTYQILKEMADAWHDMTDMERAAATELMGGKRNSNVISALISDFSIAENSLQTARGALQKKTRNTLIASQVNSRSSKHNSNLSLHL